MQNVAKFRLIVGLLVPQPSTYDEWHIRPLFFKLSPIRTNESQRPINAKK